MRTNPYGEALTKAEWEAAVELKGRPLTQDPIQARRAGLDALLSRIASRHPPIARKLAQTYAESLSTPESTPEGTETAPETENAT